MACETIEHEGLFFALWGKPSKDDFDRILTGIRRVVEKTGKPTIYISRVPPGAPPPDAEVRRYVGQIMPEVLSSCSSFHVVLEGDGFVAALKRGVMLSIFQICRQRGTLFVHSTCEEVSRHIDEKKIASLNVLLRRARDLGMLDRTPATVVPPNPDHFIRYHRRKDADALRQNVG